MPRGCSCNLEPLATQPVAALFANACVRSTRKSLIAMI